MNRNALVLAFALAFPLIGSAVTFAGDAAADTRAAVAPSAVEGRFQRYLVGPHGQVQGLLLQDGKVVWAPPHAFTAAAAPSLTAGDALKIEGRVHQTPSGTVVTHALIDHGGVVVADGRNGHGHPKGERGEKKHEKGAPLLALTQKGTVVAVLASGKGRVEGVVLDDGTTAFARHGEEFGALGLKVGDKVTLTGRGGFYEHGKGMRIDSVTLPSGETRVLPHGRKGGGAVPA